MRAVLPAILALSLATPAVATSYASPDWREVPSPNGRFVLVVDPAGGLHAVYSVLDRNEPLWSFTIDPLWHEIYFLSDDGEVVTRLHWGHVTLEQMESDDCIQFWNASGKFRSLSFEEVCPDPLEAWHVGPAPIGEFWRTWLYDLDREGDELRVVTTGKYGGTYSLTSGDRLDRHYQIIWPRYRRWLYPGHLLILALCLVVSWFVVRKILKAGRSEPARIER